MNAACLFFIEDIVRIIGFCLLFKQINDKKLFLYRNRVYLDLRLTPKAFAYYLLAVISVKRISKQFQLNLPTSSFPVDQYLMVLTKRNACISNKSNVCLKTTTQCSYRRINSLMVSESVNSFMLKEKIIDALRDRLCFGIYNEIL